MQGLFGLVREISAFRTSVIIIIMTQQGFLACFCMEINDLICLNVEIEHWVTALAPPGEERLYVLYRESLKGKG